jgi:hypothetical protein
MPAFLITLENHTSPDIRKMAKITLSNFTQKCSCPELLNTFLSLASKKNKNLNEKSFFYLTEIIGSLGDSLANLDTETLKKIFFVLGINLTESKFPENRHISKKIFCYLQNLMGNINFMKFLDLLLKENILEFNTCREISECSHQKKRSSRFSIKEDLRKRNMPKRSLENLDVEMYIKKNN